MSIISGLFSGSLLANAEAKAQQNGKTSELETALKKAAFGDKPVTGDSKEQLSSYMLDLSEEAKSYLAQQSTTTQQTTEIEAEFSLSQAEMKQLREIIEKYKDQPLTEESFNLIAEELTSIGLGANQLAAKEQVTQFNPLALFLDAFNGTSTALTSEQISTNAQTKKENYTSSIIEYWASINTAETEA